MAASNPLAIVTGASSGIGLAYARRLAGMGYDLIAVGRRAERLDALKSGLHDQHVRTVVADLATTAGVEMVAHLCRQEPVSMLVNNAGLSHYMNFTQLPADKAHEVLNVKVIAPTMLAHAVAPGMVSRGSGAIIQVAGMLAFGAMAPLGPSPGRAIYVASLAHLVAFSQALSLELKPAGVQVQALCPGIVATEFHTRQGMDLSALARMSADEVVTASLRGLDKEEVVCAPGVDRQELLDAVLQAQREAFEAQSPILASRYRDA